MYYLNPERTVYENVFLTDVQMTRSKNDPTRISPLLYIDEASHKKQHKEDGVDQVCLIHHFTVFDYVHFVTLRAGSTGEDYP